MSDDKGIHKNHFSEWRDHVMSLVDEKHHTFKSKITCRLVKSISSEHKIKNTMFSLKEDLVIVPIDKTANVAFICKHFNALPILKEIN